MAMDSKAVAELDRTSRTDSNKMVVELDKINRDSRVNKVDQDRVRLDSKVELVLARVSRVVNRVAMVRAVAVVQ